MSIVLLGSSSGSVTLQEPAVAGSTVINLPATSGTMASISSVTANGVLYVNSSSQPTSGSALVFDGSNLGLGVTPSAWRSVDRVMQAGSGTSEYGHFVSGGNGAAYGSGFYRDSGGFKYTLSATPAGRFDYNYAAGGGFTWNIAPSGTAGNAITFTQAMTLDASGNLGIGTTSPVSGSITNARGSGVAASIEIAGNGATAGSTSFSLIQASESTCYIYNRANTAMIFGTNNTERARIDSSGNLLVGKTSIASGESTSGALILSDGRVGATSVDASWFSRKDTNGDAVGFFRGTSTKVGSVSVTTTATAYNTSSDYRLKNTIAPMTNALAKVALLKPCTYKWNLDGSNGEGFIAHELAEVVPQCVTGEKDAVDAEGNAKYQGIDTSFLVATLTAAIQEQQAIIESQSVAIQALTQRITALEGA